MKRSSVYLHDIHTAVPEHSYTQEFALEFLCALPVFDESHRRFLRRIYRNTGIETRHTVIGDYGKDPSQYLFYPPTADLMPEPDLERRNDLYIAETNRLSKQAAEGLLEKLDGFDRTRITHLITVSCTGFSAPGFDLHLVRELGLHTGVHRYHLGFMGCYAALPALKLADTICRSDPESRVLVAVVELCSVHFQQKLDKDSMVAHSLFADGAAACLVSAKERDSAPPVMAFQGFASRLIENSEQDMAWKIGRAAFDMKLSVYVPRLIERVIGSAVEELTAEIGICPADIDLWAIHPGGRAILDRAAEALGLAQEDLGASYEVLRRYGNMSSASILFVLELLLRGPRGGTIFAAAFGPELTVESACLEKI
jgi:predicted naringenin-chalcone synthase